MNSPSLILESSGFTPAAWISNKQVVAPKLRLRQFAEAQAAVLLVPVGDKGLHDPTAPAGTISFEPFHN